MTARLNRSRVYILATIAALATLALLLAPMPGDSATPNYGGTHDVQMVPFLVAGQRTASQTAIVRFKLPYAARLIGCYASARASGGTTPTLTINVKEAGTTVLGSNITVTASTVSECTIADAELADEAEITIDTVIGGSSPTWDDINVVLALIRAS